MKVRLEIIDDDGTESTSVEFAGGNWKRRLLAFLETFQGETDTISEPSSYSSNSNVHVTGGGKGQHVTGQQQSSQTPLPFPQQQFMSGPPQHFRQQAYPSVMQQYPNQQIQQPVMPVPPVQQQFIPAYPPQAAIPNYQQPQYLQPNQPPSGLQQYDSGQPVRSMTSTIHSPVKSHHQVSPAVSHFNQAADQPVRRRTPVFQERMNDMSLTINERLELFLKYEYPRVWFSSQDVQQHYERIYGPIKQSTVSTYLSRMYRKNLLERRGNRTQREYRYIADEPESAYRTEEMPEVPVYHRLQY
ncbi:BlaI/MecI/CopY family transcriptional regulator [Methanolobus sp. WCC5]|uniref:BlaI/MecI/CopY family transcriptional regulator n=1 Tax=Methanolobus sp. WCC5 TaxID=3125785 RepID=UPI003243E7D5